MQTRMVLISIALIVVVLAFGTAIGGWFFSWRASPPQRETTALPPLVETVTVEPERIVERFVGYGTAEAERVTTLAAEVAGTVTDIPGRIRAGSKVEPGQVVVRLDERQYRYELEQAEALADADRAQLEQLEIEAGNIDHLIRIAEKELRIASDERDRIARLFETDFAQKREYDLVKLAYERARRVLQAQQNDADLIPARRGQLKSSLRSRLAAAQLAQLNIERCSIRAPFGGSVAEMSVEVGDRAAPGIALLSLIDTTHLEIPIRLPAAVRGRVTIQAPCRLECESMRGVAWAGTVTRLAPSADTQTRTFAAYVLVDNTQQPEPLLPGTFVRATVEGPTHDGVLLVPRGAIRALNSPPGNTAPEREAFAAGPEPVGRVLVADESVARARYVRIEQFIEDRALVRGGLQPGDRVILAPLDVLADGSPIRVPGQTGGTAPTDAHASSPGSAP